jgi:hypothetical protein
VIQSKYDEVVTPYASAFLTGAGVTNITVQNQCILDLGDHLSMPFDHIVARRAQRAGPGARPGAAVHADPPGGRGLSDRRLLTASAWPWSWPCRGGSGARR